MSALRGRVAGLPDWDRCAVMGVVNVTPDSFSDGGLWFDPELAVKHAVAHPAWGHRKVWAMVRHDGHVVSEATVLRLLRDQSLILPAHYQRERRQLAQRR